jgi:hypothetical protein
VADKQTVNLGCGTLIVIALIVLIFSNQDRSGEISRMGDQLGKLESRVAQLQSTIEDQTREIATLRRQLAEQ